ALTGTVNSPAEASKAIELAQETADVKNVDYSKLNIKEMATTASAQPFADTAITAKVKGSFIKEKLFGDKDIVAMGISVETKNGVVHLTGKVENQQQATNAVKVAKSITGVK